MGFNSGFKGLINKEFEKICKVAIVAM